MSAASISVDKKRGRPSTGIGTMVGVRLQPDDLELLDLWIAANDPELGRPEAVRRIIRSVAMRMPK
jgi:hypothetical protein